MKKYCIILIYVFCSCSKTSENINPTVKISITTTNVTEISTTSAKSGGLITVDVRTSITARGVCWHTSQNPTISNSKTLDGTGTGEFTANITDLTANTTYYVRAYATNSSGTAYGNEVSFKTSAAQTTTLPTLTTVAISAITQTAANSGGNVSADGGATVSARGVIWSTSQNPTVALSTKTSNGTGTGEFTSNITGLTANTTYYVRAYATNSTGTAYGNEVSFKTSTTQTITIPTLTTVAISAITQTTANSGGNVSADGGATVSARGVIWSTSQNPTVALSTKTSNGTGTGEFTSNITGLTANTTYYVRAYATNSTGTAYGNEVTFKTSAAQTTTIPTLTTVAISAITQTTANSGGNISADGGATVTARGVIWSISQNPTVALSTKTSNSTGTGAFTSNITNLTANTTYYVRAYATNSSGTAYGNEVSFKTSAVVTTNSGVTDLCGKTYKEIIIGNQTWTSENLSTCKYRNGDPIPHVKDDATWASLTTGAYCYFNNDSTKYAAIYGKIYNWFAVTDSRGLAPTGWHIPSQTELTTMINTLGGAATAGGKMKTTGTTYCSTNTSATNTSGFSGLPAGDRRGFNGVFNNIGVFGGFWSTTQFDSSNAWNFRLYCNSAEATIGNDGKRHGFSVRIIKD
jgi:uncharacterized protein (TIGR02145 family)